MEDLRAHSGFLRINQDQLLNHTVTANSKPLTQSLCAFQCGKKLYQIQVDKKKYVPYNEIEFSTSLNFYTDASIVQPSFQFMRRYFSVYNIPIICKNKKISWTHLQKCENNKSVIIPRLTFRNDVTNDGPNLNSTKAVLYKNFIKIDDYKFTIKGAYESSAIPLLQKDFQFSYEGEQYRSIKGWHIAISIAEKKYHFRVALRWDKRALQKCEKCKLNIECEDDISFLNFINVVFAIEKFLNYQYETNNQCLNILDFVSFKSSNVFKNLTELQQQIIHSLELSNKIEDILLPKSVDNFLQYMGIQSLIRTSHFPDNHLYFLPAILFEHISVQSSSKMGNVLIKQNSNRKTKNTKINNADINKKTNTNDGFVDVNLISTYDSIEGIEEAAEASSSMDHCVQTETVPEIMDNIKNEHIALAQIHSQNTVTSARSTSMSLDGFDDNSLFDDDAQLIVEQIENEDRSMRKVMNDVLSEIKMRPKLVKFKKSLTNEPSTSSHETNWRSDDSKATLKRNKKSIDHNCTKIYNNIPQKKVDTLLCPEELSGENTIN